MLRTVIGVLLVASFVTAMYFATAEQASVECEVCVDFGGRSACGSASGIDRESALAGARGTACAQLSGGVTRGMQCDREPPRSVSCSE